MRYAGRVLRAVIVRFQGRRLCKTLQQIITDPRHMKNCVIGVKTLLREFTQPALVVCQFRCNEPKRGQIDSRLLRQCGLKARCRDIFS